MVQLASTTRDRAVALAAAALLCEVVTQRLRSRETELPSEALAWAALPVLMRLAGRRRRDRAEIAPPAAAAASAAAASTAAGGLGVALFAVAVAVASLCRAESGTPRFHPALVPILLVAQRYMQADGPCAADATRGNTPGPMLTSIGITCIVAVVAVLDLFIWSLKKILFASLALTAISVAYIILLPHKRRQSRMPTVDIEDNIDQLSTTVFCLVSLLLLLRTLIYGLGPLSIVRFVATAAFKSLTWCFAIQLTRDTSWTVLPPMGVFTLMTAQSPFLQSSALRPLLHIFLSGLSLGQVIDTLPSRERSRSALWLFMLVSLIPYGANMLAIRSAESAAVHTFGGGREHPVDILMRGANAQFSGLLHRQSKSLEEAQAEYRRRYKIDPPPGFEAWYDFAVANQSPIIDEFDMIHKQIAPFLKLSGTELQQIMDGVFNAKESDVWMCQYTRSEKSAQCNHTYRSYDRHISYMFDTVGSFPGVELPDVKFLVNHLDEPTVFLPLHKTAKIRVTDLSRGPTWRNITRWCRPHHIFREKDERDPYALPFIKDPASAMDLCRHPEYEHLHGLFTSPSSFKLTEAMVPILSTGAPSTMGDILIPSPAYLEAEFAYDSDSEPDFDHKTNNLYWAGSTSGAFALDSDGWRSCHRQRFVQFAQNLGREQYYYLRADSSTSSAVGRVPSSFLNGRLYDVSFTRIFQCLPRACRAQRDFFPPGAWADKDAALRSRLAFDLDGNGISGRYRKLLASGSLPLKQTLLREWHDERLLPWVHYVPVSVSLEELPELVTYLTSTEAGRRRAAEMAAAGRDWLGRAMRREDMAVYVYRLMLELARLQDPNRQPEG